MEPEPPSSPIDLVTGIRPGPVVLGVAVDWVCTIVFSVFLTRYFLDPGIFNLPDDEFDAAYDAALDAMLMDSGYLLATLLAGSLATLIGAYVGANRAATLQLKYGFVIAIASGLAGLLLGLLLDAGTGSAVPAWYDAAGWLLLIPAGVLGGYLARRRANPGPA